MADSYKTSKQRKGRQHLRRDYGYGTRFKGQQKQASLNTWGAGLGLLSSVASGVAWAAQGVSKNIQAHEDVSAGAEELFKSGIESGEIAPGTEFVDPSADVKGWEKWFTAPDPSDTLSIGGREFDLSTVKKIGMFGERADKMALKSFEGTEKSLFSSYGRSLEDSLDSNVGSVIDYDSGENLILPEAEYSPDYSNSLAQFNQSKLDDPLSTLRDIDLDFAEEDSIYNPSLRMIND
tara:strand:- start:1315 stop:2019 length:705 start_codon:yes stop_codon:yes gene_type:complete